MALQEGLKKVVINGNRYYQSSKDPSKLYPSVTTVLGAALPKPGLANWQRRFTIDAFKRKLMSAAPTYHTPDIGDVKIVPKDNILQILADEAMGAPDSVRDQSAGFGTQAHTLIEDMIKGDVDDLPCSTELEPTKRAFVAWKKLAQSSGGKIIATEVEVWSDEYGYAGTMDAVLETINPVTKHRILTAIDWKTSNSMRTEYAMQVAAYAKAYEERTGEKVMKAQVVRFGRRSDTFEANCEDHQVFRAEGALSSGSAVSATRKQPREMSGGTDQSIGSYSSDELAPLPRRAKTDVLQDEVEDGANSAPRRRRESLGKTDFTGSSINIKQNRRLSDGRNFRRPSSPRPDTARSRQSDHSDDASLDSPLHPQSSRASRSTSEGFKAEPSVLDSTLQSINRIKEEKEILFEDGALKGGSVTAIVLRLAEEADRNSILAFLAVLPRYGLPEQLLGLLIDKYPHLAPHYFVQPPIPHRFARFASYSGKKKYRSFRENVQMQIETSESALEWSIIAILNFFALWLDNYFYRDFQRTACLQLTEDFLQEMSTAGFEEWHRRSKLILLRRIGHEAKSPLFTTPTGDESKSKKGKRLSTKKRSRANSVADGDVCFDTLTAADIAEQLTLREWELYRIIPESDYLDRVWLQRPPPHTSPLVRMIDHFNVISMWVASEIVNTEDLKDRANALKKFLAVCDHLFELGNFNGLMEVVAGLSLGCIQRLHKTWSLAGSAAKAIYERFSNIMTTQHNFQAYRHAVSATKIPAIPYVGVFLKDLVFVEEGNPLRLPNGFFNWDRIVLLGRLMLDIARFKRAPYDIRLMAPVQTYFASLKAIDDDDALYVASLAAENDNDSSAAAS